MVGVLDLPPLDPACDWSESHGMNELIIIIDKLLNSFFSNRAHLPNSLGLGKSSNQNPLAWVCLGRGMHAYHVGFWTL